MSLRDFDNAWNRSFGDWLGARMCQAFRLIGLMVLELFDGERWHLLHKVVDCFDLSQKRFQLIER